MHDFAACLEVILERFDDPEWSVSNLFWHF